MGELSGWIHRRSGTFSLGTFFVGWYVIQLVVFNLLGRDIARWWFYFEKPPNALSPGVILAPISHDMLTLTHIGANLLLLLVAGGLAEPYIGKRRLLTLVFVTSYLSIYVANATAFFHQLWIIAGASGGALALWAYTGLRLRHLVTDNLSDGLTISRQGIESLTAVVVLTGAPAFFLRELVVANPPHSGHLIGLLFGSVFFVVEPFLRLNRMP